MISAMKKVESRIEPGLWDFMGQVRYLRHNLNVWPLPHCRRNREASNETW